MKYMKTSEGLIEFVKSKIGCPYWYGTFGNIASESLLKYKSQQYPKHYTENREATYRSQFGKQVFDCSGLVKAYLWTDENGKIVYNSAQDLSANGFYKNCPVSGTISTMPDLPGLLVFMPGHMGVYIGNGEVVEARGFSYGVVKTELLKRPWKNWGVCPWIQYKGTGDIDVDNKLTAKDARLALRIVAGLEKADAVKKLLADIDGDGKVTAKDARMILQKVAGLLEE
jgi:cell wall-associated NlpC family hydrolase